MFPWTCPLELIAINIYGALSRIGDRNQYVIVTTDTHLELTRALPADKTTFARVTNVNFDSWIDPYNKPTHGLTNVGVQFTSILFPTLCTRLDVEHLTTTAYHIQTKAEVEQYKCKIVTRLWHHAAKNQKNWDNCIRPLTYAHNTEVCKFTITTKSGSVL